MIGVLLHKGAEAVAIAAAFVKAKRLPSTSLKFLFIFSLAGPLGILLGVVIAASADESVNGIMMALAAGTYIMLLLTSTQYIYI